MSTIDSVLNARSVVEQASVSTIGDVPNARSVVEQASVSTSGNVPNARSVVYARKPKAQAPGPVKNPKKNVNLDAKAFNALRHH